jgi:hypothetical protein
MAIARSRPMGKGRPLWLTAALLCLVLAMAGCTTHPTGPNNGINMLASSYMAIAVPANHHLDKEVDSYNEHARDNLAVAVADLRAEVATERWFDERLLKIAFPPDIAATAKALVRVNNQRIALTTQQTQAMTIAELVAFNAKHRAADAAVETQVRIIRRQLGLPPPSNS